MSICPVLLVRLPCCASRQRRGKSGLICPLDSPPFFCLNNTSKLPVCQYLLANLSKLFKESLAEFAPAGANPMESIFGGGVYVAENSSRPAAAPSNESPAKRVSFETLLKSVCPDHSPRGKRRAARGHLTQQLEPPQGGDHPVPLLLVFRKDDLPV